MRISDMKQRISYLSRSHLELRRGSPNQAKDYCTKADTRLEGPWAFGRITLDKPLEQTQGKRSDLSAVAEKILAGSTVTSLMDEYGTTMIKYSKGLKFLETEVARLSCPIWRKLSVTVLWGPTGTGKTRKAIELAKEYGEFYMLHKSANKHLWWDGYVNQPTIIMDEFRGSWCPFEVLLRILDGHPFQPEQKGGHVWAAYTKVFITSNIDPEQWYSLEKIPDQAPLFRRITEIYLVNEALYEDIIMEDVRRKPVKYFDLFKKANDALADRDWDNHSMQSNLDYAEQHGLDPNDELVIAQLGLVDKE